MSDYTETLLTHYRETAYAYAEAKAQSTYLEHYRKAVLAQEMQKAQADGAASAAAQEREALASDRYWKHLEGYRVAVLEEELKKASMRESEYRIEMWRTEQANQRLERKAYNA